MRAPYSRCHPALVPAEVVLDAGMQHGLLVGPTKAKASGATGSFTLVPKHTHIHTHTQIQLRKMPIMSAPWRPGEIKEESPKKGGQG